MEKLEWPWNLGVEARHFWSSDAEAVECPKCGAAPGVRCRDVLGRQIVPHAVRYAPGKAVKRELVLADARRNGVAVELVERLMGSW